MNPKMPELTRAQLARLARAALDNAAALLTDAQLLLDAGRWALAYGLAILAAEEYGKFRAAVALAAVVEIPDAGSPDWERFWTDFTRHKPKFAAWFGQHVDEQDWGPIGSAGDDAWLQAWNSRKVKAEQHNRLKQKAFYVDFDAEQHIPILPEEQFTKEATKEFVEQVASVIGRTSSVFEGDLIDRLTLTPLQTKFLKALLTTQNSPESRAAAIAALVAEWDRLFDADDIPRQPLRRLGRTLPAA